MLGSIAICLSECLSYRIPMLAHLCSTDLASARQSSSNEVKLVEAAWSELSHKND